MIRIGEATISRIEEIDGPTYKLKDIFSACTEEIIEHHKGLLAPHHYEPATGRMKPSAETTAHGATHGNDDTVLHVTFDVVNTAPQTP
jgi:hypothetical protein